MDEAPATKLTVPAFARLSPDTNSIFPDDSSEDDPDFIETEPEIPLVLALERERSPDVIVPVPDLIVIAPPNWLVLIPV